MRIYKQLINISCKDYCNFNNYKYETIQKNMPQNIQLPNYNTEFDRSNFQIEEYPEVYLAELLNMSVLGGTSIVFDNNNKCVYDLPLRDDSDRYDLRTTGVEYVDRNVSCISYEEAPEFIEEAVCLVGMASFNYFHFNLECLAKLCLINDMEKYKNTPILIDEVVLSFPQFCEELEMLNKDQRKIYYLKRNFSYRVGKVIYISELMHLVFNIKIGYRLQYKDIILSDLAVNLLHDNLAIENTIGRRLYISRKNAYLTRVVNGQQLENVFKEFGYEIICPETMSFKEQLKIFSEAEFIAGPSGAGLTNLLFANKNSAMICIMPKDIEISCYSNLTGNLKQKNFYLDGIPTCSHWLYYQDSYTVDENYTRTFLKEIHK